MGRGSTNVAGQMNTIGRYIYGERLFIGWGAMVTYFVAGALLLCSSCGNSSVGAQSYYGGNTMQNRYSIITKTKCKAKHTDLLKLNL